MRPLKRPGPGMLAKGLLLWPPKSKSWPVNRDATENISSQIASIQGSTTTAADVIKGISKSMDEISGYITAIQTSVEAQDTSTQDISSSIQKIADGTKTVLENVEKNLGALEKAGQSAIK